MPRLRAGHDSKLCHASYRSYSCSVGQRTLAVRERDLLAQSARQIGVDEIAGGIVGPALQQVVEHRRRFLRSNKRAGKFLLGLRSGGARLGLL